MKKVGLFVLLGIAIAAVTAVGVYAYSVNVNRHWDPFVHGYCYFVPDSNGYDGVTRVSILINECKVKSSGASHSIYVYVTESGSWIWGGYLSKYGSKTLYFENGQDVIVHYSYAEEYFPTDDGSLIVDADSTFYFP